MMVFTLLSLLHVAVKVQASILTGRYPPGDASCVSLVSDFVFDAPHPGTKYVE